MMKMICPKCGKKYGNKLTYCISCGSPLTEEGSEPAASGPIINESIALPDIGGGTVRSISMTSLPMKPIHRYGTKEFVKCAASVILSVLLFAAMIMFFGSSVMRNATDESKAAQAVRSMDVLSIPAKELMIRGEHIPEDSTVGEAIVIMTEGSGVDENNIRRIYNSSTFKEFLGSTASQYASYIRSGKKPDEITPERVKSLLGENVSVISGSTGIPLSESDLELAYTQIELSQDALACLSTSNLESGRNGEILKSVRAFLSVPFLLSELIVSAVLIAVIAFVNKSFERTMTYCAVSVFSAGLICALFTFMFSMQLGLFGSLSGLAKEGAAGVSSAVSENAYQISVMMMFLGIAAMAVARSVKYARKKTVGS